MHMRISNQISFLAALLLLTLPAVAQAEEQQSPFKGGMRSMAIQKDEPAAEQPTEPARKNTVFIQQPAPQDDGLKRKDIAPEEMRIEAEKAQEEKDAAAEQEDPGKRVWNKYKTLAAGKSDEAAEQENKDQREKDAPSEDKDAAEAEAPAKPTGFSAILQRYEENKIRQSQMRTVQMAPAPEDVAAKTEQEVAAENDAKPDNPADKKTDKSDN